MTAGAAISGSTTLRQRVTTPPPRSCAPSSSAGEIGPEARVEDEHDVGQEDVDERDGDGEAVEEQEAERAVDEAELPQARVQQPVLAEDRSPRVDADEVAREQRRRDQEQDGRLRPAGAVAQPVGDRQREKHGDGGRAEPDVERS